MRETASQFMTRLRTLSTNDSDLESILRVINSFNLSNSFPILNITQLREFYGYVMAPPPETMQRIDNLQPSKQIILRKLTAGPGLSCICIIERQSSDKLALIVLPFEVANAPSPGYRIDSAKDAKIIGVQIPAQPSLTAMREALAAANIPLMPGFGRPLTHLQSARSADAQVSSAETKAETATDKAFSGMQARFSPP